MTSTAESTAHVLPVARKGVLPSYTVRAWHRLQERLRHPARREGVARAIAGFRPKASSPRAISDSDFAMLIRDGVLFFPSFISTEQAAELRRQLEPFECQDPWRPKDPRFALRDAPRGTHVADIPAAPTLLVLQRLAVDPRIVDAVSRYFGCKPYLDSIQAWWSLTGNERPQEAENFHRDNDSIRFLKFFLYLTDVDSDSGPHKFVKGSHRDPRLLERRRHTDEEVSAAFGADRILEIQGKAGDGFLEDTFGMHKGQLPRTNTRLLVQFRYSITPSIFRSPVVVQGNSPWKDVTSLIHSA